MDYFVIFIAGLKTRYVYNFVAFVPNLNQVVLDFYASLGNFKLAGSYLFRLLFQKARGLCSLEFGEPVKFSGNK